MLRTLLAAGAVVLSLSAFAPALALAEIQGAAARGNAGAFHGGGAFRGGGAAFHGGNFGGVHGAPGGFHGGLGAFHGAGTFHGGVGALHKGGVHAFNHGVATLPGLAPHVGVAPFHGGMSPFHGTVHAFNGGIHSGFGEHFRGGFIRHAHHRWWRHRYAWWDVPDEGPCFWHRKWYWNGYREVRERVLVCL